MRVVGGVVEVAQAAPFQPGNEAPREGVGFRHAEGGDGGEQDEGERDHAVRGGIREMPGLAPSARMTSENSLTWLRLSAGMRLVRKPCRMSVERREGGDEAAHEDEGREDERPADEERRRQRDLHPEADEEEGDEEVAQAGDFGGDIERVGEGGERDAGDEGAHLAREMQPFAQFADEKAPGERADLHQLRRARDARGR